MNADESASRRARVAPPRPDSTLDVASGSLDTLEAPALPAIAAADVPAELAADGQYVKLEEIGRGGMGVIFKAQDRLTGREEVLKVMGPEAAARPTAVERFSREIQASARMDHKHIVRVYGARHVGHLLVMALEYVPGIDLAKRVKFGSKPISVQNACFYAVQAAQALQHAHDKGVIHRDVKPANLIVAAAGRKHELKVLDFGLAKFVEAADEARPDHSGQTDPSLTGAGGVVGTPDYVPPEQVLDARSADARSDVYSLGCSLYFLLAGRPPFRAKSLPELLHSHAALDADPLDRVRPDVPAGLAAVVARMMAKDPADRFQTAAEAGKALAEFARAKPVVEPLPPIPAPPAEKPRPTDWSGISDESPRVVSRDEWPAELRRRRRKRRATALAIGLSALSLLALVVLIFGVSSRRAEVALDGLPANATVTVNGQPAEVNRQGSTPTVSVPARGASRVRVTQGDRELASAEVVPSRGPVRLEVAAPKSEKKPSPAPKPAERVKEPESPKPDRVQEYRDDPATRLANSRWQMFRTSAGKREFISTIRLLPSGTILGSKHLNETSWKVAGTTLQFLHRNGRVSTSFGRVAEEDGKLRFNGAFAFGPFGHELVEAD